MKALSCFEDSFDAIYICNCSKRLCTKHFFQHQKSFPDHEINRIKTNINNKSRTILINFVITFKKLLISLFYGINLENKDYDFALAWINDWISHLNILLLFLQKSQYVSKKTFYTPFEYFLHQPDEKVSKYVFNFKFPKNIQEVLKFSCKSYIFYFNYLIFEDKQHIFGYDYIQVYDHNNIFIVCKNVTYQLFSIPEYEMGYEVLQNLASLAKITDEKVSIFWGQFVKIIYNFIKTKKIAELITQWKIIDENLLKEYCHDFNWLSKCLFRSLHQNDLTLYFIEKEEIMLQKNRACGFSDYYILANSFYKNGNLEKAKKYYKIVANLCKNSSDLNTLWDLINSYYTLVIIYLKQKNLRKVKKIANIVNKITKSYKNSGALDEILQLFYIKIQDLDNALKLAWKLKRKYEINQTYGLLFKKSYIYLSLCEIYVRKWDYKKSIKLFAHANSCREILPMRYVFFYRIYYNHGLFLLDGNWYKDALGLFEDMINYLDNRYHPLKILLLIGYAHYGMNNYEVALKYIKGGRDVLSMNNEELFEMYNKLGHIYHCLKDVKRANYYFCKAFDFIKILKINKFLETGYFYEIYYYFKYHKDYHKCEEILKMRSQRLGNCRLEYKIILFIDIYDLLNLQNKIEEANKYWEVAEKQFDIEKISLMPKKYIYNTLSIALHKLALFYFDDKCDYVKAEKVFKIIEYTLDASSALHAGRLSKVYDNLLYIYLKQNRGIEIKEYCQKYFNLLKLAGKNENFRQNMGFSKADIEKKIKNVSALAKNALSN